MNKIEAVLFDLDGVLVDTAKYHYRAWQTIAKEFDLVLTLDHNEYLKGVSRIDSFKLILQWAGKEMKESQMQPYLEDKNTRYLTLIEGLTPERGIFVELNENKCEGMIRVVDIEGDYFVFLEKDFALVGQRTKKVFELGDPITIRVKKADVIKRHLDFVLA